MVATIHSFKKLLTPILPILEKRKKATRTGTGCFLSFYFRKKATRTWNMNFLSFPKLANHLKMSANVNSFLPKRLIQSI